MDRSLLPRLLMACGAVIALSSGAGQSRDATASVDRREASDARAEDQSHENAAVRTAALAGCEAGSIPDGDVCVRMSEDDDSPEAAASTNGHHDRRGRWVAYDQIPRRPDRPADYDAYRYPVPCEHGCVVSGYDLDRPDDLQRRGRRLSHVGHGGVDLPQRRGTPILMVALEHQVGDADVLYVGPLFGTTVLTRHTVREGGQLRDYVVLFGHLEVAAPGLSAGATLPDGQLVGRVGDTGSPELVHLHLETRRVREGADLRRVAPSLVIDNATSVVCDPRNVLPLR